MEFNTQLLLQVLDLKLGSSLHFMLSRIAQAIQKSWLTCWGGVHQFLHDGWLLAGADARFELSTGASASHFADFRRKQQSFLGLAQAIWMFRWFR